jgi:hypothetical protein
MPLFYHAQWIAERPIPRASNIDHLAALIPPPRLHRHRYHGVSTPVDWQDGGFLPAALTGVLATSLTTLAKGLA